MIPNNPKLEDLVTRKKIERKYKEHVFIELRKQNRQKGRVSVPASFRSFLTTQGYNGFVSYPSFSNPALECCTQDRIEKLSNSIDTLNPFEEKEIISQPLFYLKAQT